MLFRLGVMLMSWKSDKYRIKLNINLPNGIYVLGAESGLGKTYLASWLKRLCGYGEPVTAVQCDTEIIKLPLKQSIPHKCKVFMLDEYTLYNNRSDISCELEELSKDMVVLIDCKVKPNLSCEFGYAYISLRDRFEIYVGRSI